MAVVGEVLIHPEIGWRRIDDTQIPAKYHGQWQSGVETTLRYFNNTRTFTGNVGDSMEFLISSDRLRLISYGDNRYSQDLDLKDVIIKIDSIEYAASMYYAGSNSGSILIFEVMGLEDGIHHVEIINNMSSFGVNDNIVIDAIDISESGRVLRPDEVIDIKDLKVGNRIRCHYSAVPGAVGIFSNLGKETSPLIPPNSTNVPKGDFYFIMTEGWSGERILIADRNIQHSISWDSLNLWEVATENGVKIPYKANYDKLVHYYSYDEPSGNAIDMVGNATSSLVGPTRVVGWNGKGRALQFNGTSNYASVPNDPFKGNSFSVRLKFKVPPTPTTARRLICTGSTKNKVKGFIITIDGGYMRMYYHTGTNIVPLISPEVLVNDNQWHDFLLTKENNRYTLYVDDMTIPKGVAEYAGMEHGASLHLGTEAGGGLWYNGQIDDLEIYNDVIDPTEEVTELSNFNMRIRLLTGGASPIDNENEWNQYIVNSDLGGIIVPGDNAVWNWGVTGLDLYSWALDTSTAGNSYRVVRGATAVDVHTYALSNYTTQYAYRTGFRPLLIIEATSIEKYLLQDDEGIKTFDSRGFQLLSESILTKDLFIENGIDNIDQIANRLGELHDLIIHRMVFSNQEYPAMDMSGIPINRFIETKKLLDLRDIQSIDAITLTANQSGDGGIAVVVSTFGSVWKSYNFNEGRWNNIVNSYEIPSKGMSIAQVNELDSQAWNQLLHAGGSYLRMGFYLSLESEEDIAILENLSAQVDIKGEWIAANHGEDYAYSYPNSRALKIDLFNGGSYKVGYMDREFKPTKKSIRWEDFE